MRAATAQNRLCRQSVWQTPPNYQRIPLPRPQPRPPLFYKVRDRLLQMSQSNPLMAQQRRAALKQKDYDRRETGKQLLAQLEALLPQQFRSEATRNGAGARSVGGNGRAMNDVINDVINHVAYRRNTDQPSVLRVVRRKSKITRGARQAERQSDDVDILSVSREAMLSAESRGMFCIEVSMTGEQVHVCVLVCVPRYFSGCVLCLTT